MGKEADIGKEVVTPDGRAGTVITYTTRVDGTTLLMVRTADEYGENEEYDWYVRSDLEGLGPAS